MSNKIDDNEDLIEKLKDIFSSIIPHCVHPVTSGTRKSLVVWALGPQYI